MDDIWSEFTVAVLCFSIDKTLSSFLKLSDHASSIFQAAVDEDKPLQILDSIRLKARVICKMVYIFTIIPAYSLGFRTFRPESDPLRVKCPVLSSTINLLRLSISILSESVIHSLLLDQTAIYSLFNSG